MSVLKRRIGKAVPVWAVIGIILVGTAAGAFVWISNIIERNATVTGMPIELDELSAPPIYTNVETEWRLNYSINEIELCTGYVWIMIWCSSEPSITTADANITGIYVEPFSGSGHPGSLVTGYPQNTGADVIEFVFEDPLVPGPFDFSEGESAFDGEIWIYFNIATSGNYYFQVAITSSL